VPELSHRRTAASHPGCLVGLDLRRSGL